MILATLALLASGVLLFGGNYPWVYMPLAAAAGMIGLWALVSGEAPSRGGLATALALVAGCIAAHLVPLPVDLLRRLSPATTDFLLSYNVEFGLPPASQEWHPLSISPQSTWVALGLYVGFALLILGLARWLTWTRARRLVGGLTVLAAVVALTGIVQGPGPASKVYGFWQPMNLSASSVFGPFVNRNHFAGWMLMALPVCLGYLVSQVAAGMPGAGPGVRGRVIWFGSPAANRLLLTGFAIALMALATLLSLSRSGVVCLTAALAINAAMVVWRTRAVRRTVAMAYMVALAGSAAAWAGMDRIVGRFNEPGTDFSLRLPIWADTWDIVTRFWPLGTGVNTYGISTVFFQTRTTEGRLREAHNEYLQLLAEGGLPLALLVAIAVALLVREIWRSMGSPEGESYWLRLGASTGLVAIALQSTVEFSLQMPGNAVLFCVVVAIAVHTDIAGRARRRVPARARTSRS